MITEDYVSFEVAKLLKEKGFEGQCHFTRRETEATYGEPWNATYEKDIPIPTLQMAMKWLRETYNLEIYPYHNDPNNRHSSEWWFEIIKYPNSVAEYESGIDEEVDTYEEACEAAIKYCLENLL